MLDVISIGAATEDVFVYVPLKNFAKDMCVFYPGTKIDIEGMEYFTGGGATNTSVGLSRLGVRAGIMCAVGNDESAQTILSELKKERVDSKNVIKLKGTHTSYSVILTGFGRDRVILCYSNSHQMFAASKNKIKNLKAKWFYITSLHSDGKMLREIAKRAKKIGAKIALNPGQKELALGLDGISRIFGKVDILLVNSHEALKLTGSTDTQRNLLKLLKICRIVVITCGKEGAYATDGANSYYMKPFDVKIADVTGAGDAFGSGFMGAVIKGKGLGRSIEWGTANASSVVMYFGTKNELLGQSGIGKFIKKYKRKENAIRIEKL
ncbi:MAG TPA: sugar kinase [archaeon]|nr:sugar kinase [archaeon]